MIEQMKFEQVEKRLKILLSMKEKLAKERAFSIDMMITDDQKDAMMELFRGLDKAIREETFALGMKWNEKL